MARRHLVCVLAVIPARGGSTGVPDKNLRHVGGRSLVARTVATALRSPSVDRVVVSTDEPRIAREARHFGAEVIERPPELAGDYATSEAALLHALDSFPAADLLVLLQCTSPFTQPADIEAAIAAVRHGDADSAFSSVPFHGFVWRRDEAGAFFGVNHSPDGRERRQDRPVELLETGAVYVMDVAGFRAARHRFFGRTVAVSIDSALAIEIDTYRDLEVARQLAGVGGTPGSYRLTLPVPALVALDFDGVFTDNRVIVDQDGREAVVCHRGDGQGLAALRDLVPIVVLSTEENPVVSARCGKLGLDHEQGLGAAKLPALRSYAEARNIDLADALFVGNDVNDLEPMGVVGTAVAVADAVPEVKAVAHVVLTRRGGEGALRELSDALLRGSDQSRAED